MLVVHAWVQRAGNLSDGQGKLAILLGFVLFFAIYGFVWLLRPNIYVKKHLTAHRETIAFLIAVETLNIPLALTI